MAIVWMIARPAPGLAGQGPKTLFVIRGDTGSPNARVRRRSGPCCRIVAAVSTPQLLGVTVVFVHAMFLIPAKGLQGVSRCGARCENVKKFTVRGGVLASPIDFIYIDLITGDYQ